jgi:hypothetical protein
MSAASRRQVLQAAGQWGAWAAGSAMGMAATAAQAEPSSTPAVVTPPEVQAQLPQARLQGASRFRYFGFHVYDAQLWVPVGFDAARLFVQPLALCLIYARSLKASDIAERSIEEMRRQGPISDAEAQRWTREMTAAFADVRSGDRLTGVYDAAPAGSGARFFFNGQATQTIADARFAKLFFGIWLSSATSAPALRRELLGGPGG